MTKNIVFCGYLCVDVFRIDRSTLKFATNHVDQVTVMAKRNPRSIGMSRFDSQLYSADADDKALAQS
jgi:hypothetical protein